MKITKNDIEVRMGKTNETLGDNNTVYGRAIAFESPSNNLPNFVEIIHRGAITQELLDNCDVYCRVNHDDNYIMARSNHGKGSLHLELDDNGLNYSFEIPQTEKGKELAEHIRRGEITQSSFSFVIAEDGRHFERRDGKTIHHIDKIAYLYDVAPVFLPAYNATSCSLRTGELLEAFEKENNPVEEVEETPNTETVEETTTTEERGGEREEENDNTDNVDAPNDANDNVDNLDNQESTEEVIDNEDINNDDSLDNDDNGNQDNNIEEIETTEEVEEITENNTNNRNIAMNKSVKFSLIKAINNVLNNKPQTGAEEAVCRAGQEDMANSGLAYTGAITIPLSTEDRNAITVTTEGDDTVGVDVWNILPALYAKNVLVEAGAQVINGLSSDVVVPVMSQATVTWEDEMAEAGDANITFDSIKLTPKRLTAYVDISKKFLIQTNPSSEEYIRQNIINAVRAKIEETLLGKLAETTARPAGIRYDKTAETIANFTDLCDLEASVEEVDYASDKVYVISPKAKASLRGMAKTGAGNGLVYENGEIDGTKALSTAAMGTDKDVLYGAFNQLIIGNFGSMDIVVDQVTQARKNAVRLVINIWLDGKVARENAIAYGTISE